MKKINYLLLILLFTSLFSCKKGTQDPIISLKSRTGRLTGTWTLKNSDIQSSMSGTSTNTNDVNSDNTVTTMSGNTYSSIMFLGNDFYNYNTKTFDNGKLTITNDWSSETVNTTKEFSLATLSFKNVVTKNKVWHEETITLDFSLELSIYNDNTYEYTQNFTNINYEGHEYMTVDDNAPTIDTLNSPVDNGFESTYTEEGVWHWDENTEKNKILIDAGPLQGYLVRLSNNEIILESVVDNNQDLQSVETEKDVTLPTYVNASETKKGTITTIIIQNQNNKYQYSTWEKTDKASKRKDE